MFLEAKMRNSIFKQICERSFVSSCTSCKIYRNALISNEMLNLAVGKWRCKLE